MCAPISSAGLRPTQEGPFITPVTRPVRQGWDSRMQAALAAGETPQGELLEAFSDAAFEGSELAMARA